MTIGNLGSAGNLQLSISPGEEFFDIPHRPRVGMCSVTLKAHGPRAVIDHAAAAGLESIEWGSDVHVPAGDIELARVVGQQTRDAGLAVASYGSYFQFPWCRLPGEETQDIIATAVALGAPRIRVWAGPSSSADTGPEDRVLVTESLSRFCRAALKEGLSTALEFHFGTLTDNVDSTLRLLGDLGEGASTYWQPRIGASDSEVLKDLEDLGPDVSTLHVFSWGSQFDRHPLSTREDMWRQAMRRTVKLPRVTDVLLEFLPNDDAALLVTEARQLRKWADEAVEGAML